MENNLREMIEKYVPFNEQEERDKEVILEAINTFKDVLTRNNKFMHFSSSSIILNKERTKTLVVYHKIYNSWVYPGGHADGESNLLAVAKREVWEETGLKLEPVSNDIFGIQACPVKGHVKNGKYISAHTHYDVVYLFEADENEKLSFREDESKGIKWIPLEETTSEEMADFSRPIFEKVIKKLEKERLFIKSWTKIYMNFLLFYLHFTDICIIIRKQLNIKGLKSGKNPTLNFWKKEKKLARIEEKVESLITTKIQELGYELYDVEYVKEGKDYYLRIYIDREKGIDLNDCELVSNSITEILDKEDYIKEQYFLEVSSPGIERILKKDKHLQDNIEKKISIKLFKPQEGQKQFIGILKKFDEKIITIEVSQNLMEIERTNIAQIKTVYDWN